MVICDYGIYIFETKYWEGDIYYNISKESLKGTKHELLNRYIFFINKMKMSIKLLF
ncbi:nuclease-related domain-containing protein [Staphylococcus borealis]|uniref:nuclease-related domain-containing protein n=1 Tax=Staphylococcus borealis TaxID=2742203 RepID=UPI001E3326DE|nr:nuclease-related domain-containing protein [Staphylococcus borealis]